MRAPLLHIGYHKTGTTWLQGRLFSNREAGFAWTRKRIGGPVDALVSTPPLEFDAAFARAALEPHLTAAARGGAVPVVSLERLAGHPFSGGYDSREIAHRLAAVLPEARVMMVIREQRSMLIATYKQYVRAGGPASLERFALPAATPRRRLPSFDLAHFEYHRLIALYRELFGAPNVLVMAYEQFAQDPRAYVLTIARFAGAAIDEQAYASLPFDERTNLGRGGASVALSRRLNAFARRDVNPLPSVTLPRLEAFGRKRVARIDELIPAFLHRRADERLRRAAAEIVGDRFASSNGITSELTGLDLAGLGYAVPAPEQRSAGDRIALQPARQGTPAERRAQVAARREADTTEGYAERRRMARKLAREARQAIDRAEGFAAAAPGELPGSGQVAETVAATDARGDDHPLPPSAFSLDSAYFRFALSREVVAPVAAYLGVLPILARVDVWSAPAPAGEALLWQLDDADTTQVRVFVHGSDIGPDSGALTILDARTSKLVAKRARHGRDGARLADDAVREAVGAAGRIALEGPRGAVWFVDTSRCFHVDGVPAGQVAVFQYVTPHALESAEAPYRAVAGAAPTRWAELLLGVA